MSSKKDKQIAQSRHEDEVLNRALLWIGGAAILIAFILFLNRYYVHYRTTEIMFAAALAKALPIVAVLGLVGCAVGAFLARKAHLAQKSMKWYAALSVFCVGVAVCAGLTWRFSGTGTQFLCGVILATAVLALVYYLYQHEFFVIALSAAVGIVGLWLVRRAAGAYAVLLYGYLLVAAAFLLAVALGARKLQKNGGEWKGRRIFHKKAAYPLVYLTCGIVAALMAAAAVLGAGVAYYLIFVAVAWLVVMAVYFTVKLM